MVKEPNQENAEQERRSGSSPKSFEDALVPLLEAMTKQARVLNELSEVTRSIAVSEQRESIAELIEAVANGRMVAQLESRRSSGGSDSGGYDVDVQAEQVRQFYNQTRANLGRRGSEGFYVDVTPMGDRARVSGAALFSATDVQIGHEMYHIEPGHGAVMLPWPDDGDLDPPLVRVLSGGRVLALGRIVPLFNTFDNEI